MTEQFPPANEFIVSVSVDHFEWERLQLRKYLNLHYLGDVDANEMNENGEMVAKYPEKETEEFKNAIANSYRVFKFNVKVIYDVNGVPTMELLND